MTDSAPRHGRTGAAIRTFLIADIRGWTAFTAEHGDEAASALARKFAEIAHEGVEAWGGRVVELRGDEALAVFESGRDALRAAAELQAAFVAETRLDPSLPLAVGIGLDAGEAVEVGDGYRGAALNVAARLCSLASASETIATRSLRQLAGPLPGLEFVDLPPTKLKGLSEPVAAVRVEVTGEHGVAPDLAERQSVQSMPTDDLSDGGQPPLPAELEAIVPLAGRLTELRWLAWHWRRAGHGAGRTVVISGQPGIGKTRLAAELAARAHADGASVTYLGPTADTDAMTGALAETGRNLIVVDDLDAAPLSGARRISEVVARLDGTPTLLLLTHREEAAAQLLSIIERLAPPQQRVTLGPLEPDAVRAIAALYAGRAARLIPIAEIYERSGGVPAAVHRWSSIWARESVAARLEASATRTSDGRQELRAAEEDLIGDVSDLELVRERSELYAADRAPDGTPAATAPRRDICPYKGLAAFDANDAEYYFGRERLVAELVTRLVGSSFLALVGASGSGKSSALRAGLLPAFAGGVLPGSAAWRQEIIRPGEHPLAELEGALGGTLDETIASLSADSRLLLVVDQFEEVFNSTRDEAERNRFIDLITGEHDNLKVVLAMRADHYGHCAAYPQLATLVARSQVLVGPLTHAELVSVIEHPAQRVGLRVEPGLTEALLSDLGDEPGSLPLLSTALLELWQARQSGRLTLASYRSSGGVQGAVGRLAESAYAGLSEDEREIARSIFLRLAGTGEGEGVVRRRVPLSEFDQSDQRVANVLARLTDARLLTSGDGYVEVAHEALLREWPRLQRWLEEDGAGRQLRIHLIGAARDWEGRGREPGDLYRSARLAAALDWSAEHNFDLNALEREFLEQSRLASEAEADRQRRTNRRLRTLLAGAGVLLIVALAAGGFAFYQGQLASQSEQFARSRELAASAIAARDDDPTLSKLLAIEAASIAEPPVESVASLHRAWDADRIIFRYAWPADHEVSSVNADLDPSGRYIAASGSFFSAPHDYVEVVDRTTALGGERLWSFESSAEGLALGNAYYTPDGSRVVFGAFFDSEPPADSSAAETGIHVRDALTGAEIQRIDTGACGAAVVAVSNRTAIAYTSSASTCLTWTDTRVRRDISLESIDLTTGERTTLTTAAWPNDEDAVSVDGSTIAFNEIGPEDSPGHVVQQLAVVARPAANQRADLPVGDFGGVHDLSVDGSRVLVDDADGKLQVWDLDVQDLAEVGLDPEDPTGERRPLSGFAPDPSTHNIYAQFAPDGASVFSTGDDGRLHQWNIDSGEEMLAYGAPGGRPSPNAAGLVLVPSSEGPTALLLDTSLRAEIASVDVIALASTTVPNGDCESTLPGNGVATVAQIVAVADMCGDDEHPDAETITLLDRTSLQPVGSVNAGFVGALSLDGTRLARRMQRVDLRDEQDPEDDELLVGPVDVVDTATGNSLFQLEGLCWFNSGGISRARRELENDGCSDFPQTPFALFSWQAHEIRWAPDGTMIAMVDLVDGYFGVWNAADGRLIAGSLAAYDPSKRASDIAFTPDSKHLVVSYTSAATGGAGATFSGLATISTTDWRVEATRTLPEDVRELDLLGLSADGSSMIAVAGFVPIQSAFTGQGTKALYWLDPVSLADTRPVRPRIHAASIQAAALSEDGTLVATGATDGSIRVWDESGQLVNEIDFPGMSVFGLAFISDTHLGVVLDDGQLRVVTIDPGELLEIARNSLTRGFTEDECDRYNFDPCPSLEEMQNGTGSAP